ncbi:dipeptide ABC transporter ATP-binding protein [Flavobacteriaceae bacterium Ap0902]|nr:dipeptide ABC transporter ATP-binding protein [Flavobacteriaceae bacterium Ap0902]
MNQDNLIEIKNLSISFKGVKVLHNLDFSVKRGEILGVVGESGSGKSLTSLAIMGLLPSTAKTQGEIFYKHEDKIVDLLTYKNNDIKGKAIGMIFQEPMTSLNPSTTCGKQILESIHLHQSLSATEAKKKVISLLKQVKLPDPERIYNAYPHELSGGQKQRILIAIAISSSPQLLIADEPTTALDVTVQKSILELLKDLNKEMGMSIIFISHDLGVIAEISNRVLVMYKGDIVEKGTSSQIFHDPKQPYTQGLLACRPNMKYRAKKLLTISDYTQHKNTQVEIETADERNKRLSLIYDKKPILIVNNLNKYFHIHKGFWEKKKTVKAVNHINFALYEGETLGLVGESGSGKTTLSRTLLLLEKPDAGEILYHNTDLASLSNHQIREIRKDIQIIFQDPYASLNPRYTTRQILLEPMKIHGIGKNKAERNQMVKDLLDQVNLPQTAMDKYPHEFSGGQRQRIGIARAIALNPKIIICDESVSALDVSVQATILNLLNDLKKELKLTYLFISHDLSVVKYMSDRLIILQNGEIMETGDTDSIYLNPSTNYTKDLIDAIPTIQ